MSLDTQSLEATATATDDAAPAPVVDTTTETLLEEELLVEEVSIDGMCGVY
ncbi:MAG: mycofactocin precursor MftA [Microthrixaceae bacterium]